MKCKNDHSFDLSKERTVNLLMKKKIKAMVGDSREQVVLRERVLSAGAFEFLEDGLFERVQEAFWAKVGRAEADDDDDCDDRRSNEEEDDVEVDDEAEDVVGVVVGARKKKLLRKRRLRKDARAKRSATEKRRISFVVMDVGCADGYWLGKLANRFSACERISAFLSMHDNVSVDFVFIGLDASKDAIKIAAKRTTTMMNNNSNNSNKEYDDTEDYDKRRSASAQFSFAVADANELPILNNKVDVSLSIFAPRNGKEIERTLTKEKHVGKLIIITPSERHLEELRSQEAREQGVVCLKIEKNKADRIERQLLETASLRLASPETLSEREHVFTQSDAVKSILLMGASASHQTPESLLALETYWDNKVTKTLTFSFETREFVR